MSVTCPTRVRHVFFILVQFSHTFDQIELQKSVLHVNRSEFHEESNGHGPGHMTRVFYVSDTFFSTLVQFFPVSKLKALFMQVSFFQESIGNTPRHATCECHVFVTYICDSKFGLIFPYIKTSGICICHR